MKVNKTPEKIFVNPNALQYLGYDCKNYMFIHDSVFDEIKCTIEYTRTDVFIEKVESFLNKHDERDYYTIGYIKRHFKKIIKEVVI